VIDTLAAVIPFVLIFAAAYMVITTYLGARR
jgi:hypothetical protein